MRARIRSTLTEKLAALGIAATGALISMLPALDLFQGVDVDLLHAVREAVAPVHADPAESPVAVVAITPDTFTAPELDGIPRILWTDQMAQVQDRVLGAGGRVFGWDIIMQNSAASAMGEILDGRIDLEGSAEQALRRLDRDLLISMNRHGRGEGRVVLGMADLGHGLVAPHNGLARQAGGNANLRPVNAYTDPDGIVRGIGLYYRTADGGQVPSFALEVAARQSGADFAIEDDGSVTFRDRSIPVYRGGDGDVNLMVNFDTGPGAVPTYRFQDILTCDDADYLSAAFDGRAVLFGFVTDLEDRKLMSNRMVRPPDMSGAPDACDGSGVNAAAFARNTEAGVYLHAHAVANLLRGNPVALPGEGTRVAMVFLLALLGAGLAAVTKPYFAVAALGLSIIGYWAVCAVVFADGTVLPLVEPTAGAVVALAGMVAFRFITADQERARVRQTFSQYLDRKVIEAMIDSGDIPELGGENRQLTCFFSDIEAFSSISEKMGPPELVAFLNEYFEIIGVEIENHGGIIERFLGDAVCAVFGAPVRDENHAISAVRCALAIDRGLMAAQDRFDVPEGRKVRTRIGINTGDMTAGNVGAARRKTYTVMGDSVNLAARLESVNKQYGTLLMAGDETVRATGELFEWRHLDRVRVVGRDTPVDLFEPLGMKGDVDAERLALRDSYESALSLYQAGNFAAAESAFQILAESGDDASAKAVERCRRQKERDGSQPWKGVTDLTSK
ncbi:MAG: adenylate/guanylate cyclase domain-containing protein [Alphaproteobacteria bacterium]